jgi:hypothetical protein
LTLPPLSPRLLLPLDLVELPLEDDFPLSLPPERADEPELRLPPPSELRALEPLLPDERSREPVLAERSRDPLLDEPRLDVLSPLSRGRMRAPPTPSITRRGTSLEPLDVLLPLDELLPPLGARSPVF